MIHNLGIQSKKIVIEPKASRKEDTYDAVLIGAGIMSATLAALLHELEPDISLLIVERLHSPGLESSSAWNNAGTGHAANCELNYTPLETNGSININKALSINDSFELSLQFWATLTSLGRINPKNGQRGGTDSYDLAANA